MGLFGKIGKSLSSIGKSLSKTYKTVDKKVGGVLPGGVKPSSKESKSSSSSKKSSSSSSSSRSSSPNMSVAPTMSVPRQTSSSPTSSKSSPRSSKVSLKASTPVKVDKRTGKTYGTVEAYVRQKSGGKVSEALGLAPLSDKLRTKRGIIRTEKSRSRTGNTRPIREAELLGLTAVNTLVDFGKGVVDLPETAYRIARNPRVLKELPKSFKKSGEDFGKLVKVSPGEAFVQVGGEILLLKGTGKAINTVGKTSGNTLTKLNPKYVGDAKVGKTLKINTGKGKSVNLKVVGKIPKETLKGQTGRAGKKLTAISSQADTLLKAVRRSKVVRKPIPGEENFNAVTKKLLNQFDKGTISRKNLVKLDSLVKKQGAKGLLERSFFADPSGKIRPSRLGLKDREANLIDYLTEDITFRKAKAQILLFENVKVQQFPKALRSSQ